MAHIFTPLQLGLLDALKSGRFIQGRECLTSIGGVNEPDMHCCLGVACNVHNALAEKLGLKPLQVVRHADKVSYDKDRDFAPEGLRNSLGLRSEAGHFKTPATFDGKHREYISLADMNDAGYSFAEIAAYIEANPENVFLS